MGSLAGLPFFLPQYRGADKYSLDLCLISSDFDVLKSEIDVLFNAENPEPNDIIRNAVRGVGMGLEGNEDV